MDPRQMCTKPEQCLVGIKEVLDALIVARGLHSHQRDSVLAEYAGMLKEDAGMLQSATAGRIFRRTSEVQFVLQRAMESGAPARYP